METIIEKQEKEFWNMCEEFYVGSSSDLHINKHPTKILSWHKEKVKQIFEQIIKREWQSIKPIPTDSQIQSTPFGAQVQEQFKGFNSGKQDTIQYLQEQIKKL